MTSLGCIPKSENTDEKYFTKKSISISIPISNKDNNYTNIVDEYSLNCNNFNPNKMSPPDVWKNRLQYRVDNYSISKHFNE